MAAETASDNRADGFTTPGPVARMLLATFAWIDERYRIRNYADQIKHLYYQLNFELPRTHTEKYKLRVIWYWYPLYTLGSITFLAFLFATISGILLTFYYVPSTAPVLAHGHEASQAWASVVTIMTEVPLGFMIRAVHFWSAMVMVAAVVLHMIRVYFVQAYKKPRELNWLLGVVLMLLTLGLGYTGYLLPWSQLSFWAGRIGLEMSLASPVIGKWLAGLMFGGVELGQQTVTRMYILHVLLLPILTFGATVAHVFIVWWQGIAEPH